MHFYLFGATGRTGQHVVSEILAQGHTAVALVRTPGSLGNPPRSGLTVVVGSPLSKADIKAAVAAAPPPLPAPTSYSSQQPPTLPSAPPIEFRPAAAAIITLNSVRTSNSPFAAQLSPARFLADSCANICEVLAEEAGVYRFIVMSTAGVGDSWAGLPLLTKAFMAGTNVKYALADHNLVDQELRQTKLVWTLVRASRLVYDGPPEYAEKEKEKQLTAEKKQTATTEPDITKAPIPIIVLESHGGGVMHMSDRAHVSSVARFLVEAAVDSLFMKSAVVVRD